MTDIKLGGLIKAFADFYWSIPVEFVRMKITEWHPDVPLSQIERVLAKCRDDIFRYHCWIVEEGVDEPELVTEHLIAVDENDFLHFIATRISGPYYEPDEATLLMYSAGTLDIPEVVEIRNFGKTELFLDDGWSDQLVDDCILYQPTALYEGSSWVNMVLSTEMYGKIRFQTVEQVRRFRDLGNRLYQALPNPVLKGWKPSEVENPPVLKDDIPESDEDIPDGRAAMDKVFEKYGGREKVRELLEQGAAETRLMRKIGRNDPCPCGSGLKYKKCKCEKYHKV